MKYTPPSNVIDLNHVWWEKQLAGINDQAEQVENAIYEVLDQGFDCEYEPGEIQSFIGLSNFRNLGEKSAWTALTFYVDRKPVFLLNAVCDRKQGAEIINCGRLIRNKIELYYCSDFEEVLASARRYAKNHIIPKLEFEND